MGVGVGTEDRGVGDRSDTGEGEGEGEDTGEGEGMGEGMGEGEGGLEVGAAAPEQADSDNAAIIAVARRRFMFRSLSAGRSRLLGLGLPGGTGQLSTTM